MYLLMYIVSQAETDIRITPDAVAGEKGRNQKQYCSICNNHPQVQEIHETANKLQ